MNSLQNLNDWSNDDIPYSGNAAYVITFDSASPTNQTTTVIEDQAFASPPGINITAMDSAPRDLEFTVDLSGVALPATIDWGTLPYFISSQIAGTNIFKLVGAITADIWNQVKTPSITIIDQATNFSYTCTITYPDPSNTANNLTKTWTTSVTVTAVANISTPSDYTYTRNSIGTISGAPQILNTAGGTYGILITPSLASAVYTLASTGAGGTSVFDPVLKTLTISGTKTQVNSHLNGIQLTPASNENRAFTLGYRLTNPSGVINTVTQSLTATDPFVINTATYLEDTPFSLGYVVKDTSATATSFTISVAQSTPVPSVSPGYFTVNGSNVGNTWTASNTKTNINAANVIYTPPVDYTGTLTFTVNQSKLDNGNTVVQVSDQPVNIVNAGNNPEITNMVNRSFTSNVVNNIFSTQTPVIVDGPNVGQVYTITLSTALGKFGNSAANAISTGSYSFTGFQSQCNSELAAMVFVPAKEPVLNGTFSYTQSRDSVSQANLTLSLTGTSSPVPGLGILTFTANNSFTPTFSQSYWGNIQILTVGGGGSGSGSANSSQNIRGGGGGGQVVTSTVSQTVAGSGTWNIVVGTGGLPPGAAGNPSYVTISGNSYGVANGGGGASSVTSTGGSSGSRPGGTGNTNASGGGAGYGTNTPAGDANALVGYGGDGEKGLRSSITGANIPYGGGGGGGVTASGSGFGDGSIRFGGGAGGYGNGQSGVDSRGGGGGGGTVGHTGYGGVNGGGGKGGNGIVIINIS